jgi:hypothetical protein
MMPLKSSASTGKALMKRPAQTAFLERGTT